MQNAISSHFSGQEKKRSAPAGFCVMSRNRSKLHEKPKALCHELMNADESKRFSTDFSVYWLDLKNRMHIAEIRTAIRQNEG